MTGGPTGGLPRRRCPLGTSVVVLKSAAAGATAAQRPGHQGTPTAEIFSYILYTINTIDIVTKDPRPG